MTTDKTLPQIVAEKKREVFLAELRKTGKPLEAARAAGYNDTAALYIYRQKDEDFAEAWEAAMYASADLLVDAAVTRAVDGVEKSVFFKGEVVGSEVNYSDTLLIELMRARRPKEFRRANQEVNVDVNVKANIGVAILPMTATSTEAWEADAKKLVENQKQLPAFESNVIDVTPTVVEAPTQTAKPEERKVSMDREMGRA